MSRGEVDDGPVFVASSVRDVGRPARMVYRSCRAFRLDEHCHSVVRDVFCTGMYRACSTWQYAVVSHLVEQRLAGERLGYMPAESYALQYKSRGDSSSGDRIGRWRVLKSHEGHGAFAQALRSGRALAVYVFRDLRDVIDSLMYMRHARFEQLLRQGMMHQILANDRFWRSQPGVLVQRYEELVDDPATAVVQLARHLGLGVTRREAMEIADEFSLESNRRRIEALRRRLTAAGIDLDSSVGPQACDPVTLLHWNHLRPAGVACCERKATSRERTLLDHLCGDWLRANGYASTSRRTPRGGRPWLEPGLSLRYRCDLALGRAAVSLRRAAARFPLVATMVKRLLRMTCYSSGDALVWRETEPKVAADGAFPIALHEDVQSSSALPLSPCPAR